MILVIDNYDSFTWNLADLLHRHTEVRVVRNDAITVPEIREMRPAGILLSPGPGRPADSGVCVAIMQELAGEIPILGVCLGMQLIGEHFGGQVVHAQAPMHGKTSRISHINQGVFAGLPPEFTVMRYHSLVVARDTLPACLEATALTPQGEIMGLRHRGLSVEGVQFHPESVLSEFGEELIVNWLKRVLPYAEAGKAKP